MNKTFIYFLFTVNFLSFEVLADNFNERMKCISAQNISIDLLVKHDFLQLKKLSEWGIKNCNKVMEGYDYYKFYESLSKSLRYTGDSNKALKEINICIKGTDDNITCREEKIEVLKTLGKFEEAKKENKYISDYLDSMIKKDEKGNFVIIKSTPPPK